MIRFNFTYCLLISIISIQFIMQNVNVFFNSYNMICNTVDLKDAGGLTIAWSFPGMFENVTVSMLHRVTCLVWKFSRAGRRATFLPSSIKWHKNCKCLPVNHICMIFLTLFPFTLHRASKQLAFQLALDLVDFVGPLLFKQVGMKSY